MGYIGDDMLLILESFLREWFWLKTLIWEFCNKDDNLSYGEWDYLVERGLRLNFREC